MKPYLDLLTEVLNQGELQKNRTGTDAIRLPYGSMMRFDMSNGFPATTTKKLAFNAMKGELLAFIEGATDAARFRELGCNFWDQNANENKAWLASPHRHEHDDLGKIYGYQWRFWNAQPEFYKHADLHERPENSSDVYSRDPDGRFIMEHIDQLKNCIETIKNDPTNRRIIISAWRPDQLLEMALPPCHVLYQFSVNVARGELSLCMYQRSADMFLGVPMNIASASLLLHIVAKLTGYTPAYFTHFVADAHIYVNHIDQVREQLSRKERALPDLILSDQLVDIDSITPEMIRLDGYFPHDAIKAAMAV